jgi:hypothetical protein
MDNSNEVIREIDVFFSDNLDLFITQFPLKPVYSDPVQISSAKFKSNHKKLELEIPTVGTSKTNPKSMTYNSSVVAQRTILGAGIIQGDEMFIAPIKNVLQMRPLFKDLKIREMIDEDDESLFEKSKTTDQIDKDAGLQQVQLKRKETERINSSRSQSYSQLQAQEDLEPWKKLDVYDIGSCILCIMNANCTKVVSLYNNNIIFYFPFIIFRFSRIRRKILSTYRQMKK